MRGQNVKCRMEPPTETRTTTGGRTRKWLQMPEFNGSLSDLSVTEQELWERNAERASYRLVVMARAIPTRYRDQIRAKNRIVILNDRNELEDETYDVLGVSKPRRARRILQFDMILGKVK